MRTVRYGIIGTANIVNSTHIPCIQRMAGTEIVALCDVDAAALAKTRARVGAPAAVRDYREVLALEEVDAVVVATPNDTHAAIVVDACAHGKHVLCEKPMAISAADCDRMIAAAEAAGTVLQIAQPYRYSPFYRQLADLLASGAIGAVEMMWTKEFMRWGDVAPSNRAWRMYQGRSGGALVEKNCHHLDLMNWMIGARPVKVCAFGGKNCFHQPEIIDNAALICEYDNGARAMLLLALFTSWHMIDLEVGAAGERGRVEAYDQAELYLFHGGQGDARRRPDNIARPPASEEDEGFHSGAHAMHRDFLRCVRDGGRPFCDARVGKDSILIGLAGERSIREGRVVEIAEIL
ncbi:MAG TPA: Gfo/Idh/MocA family oxidoreductase [Armatimonadota bacterium]|nr:Gfo/Idh/MocA family oxidoreductase [Armatimonadota bacterium]